jgi:N-acetylglucosamine-6-phosphate deacetylase
VRISRDVHCLQFLRHPSPEEIRQLAETGRGNVRLLTLAPELPGAQEAIAEARHLGIAVAIGHSNATFEQTLAAVGWGARLVTHLFNASGPLTAREPGVIGAALVSEQLTVSLIADGIHVHPASMQLALRAKGPRRTVLVTDAMPPVGTDLGAFDLYGERVVARDGACYTPSGRLAGSMLTMGGAVRNVCRLLGTPLPAALSMASANPARIIGERRLGSLRVGAAADLTVLDDELRVWLTMVRGSIAYQAGTAQEAIR